MSISGSFRNNLPNTDTTGRRSQRDIKENVQRKKSDSSHENRRMMQQFSNMRNPDKD